ncbi:MAG: diguanylate cyclase [Ilumatobacteraceae bacterium]
MNTRFETTINAVRPGEEIVGVAEIVTGHADADPTVGELVVVARTGSGGHRTLGGGRIGPLRAAVSVAVAAGNNRLWEGSSGTEVVERSVRSLPEIVRTAAEASGLTTVFTGCVDDGTLAALAIWFPVGDRVASVTQQRETIDLLEAAAERQRAFLDARAAEAASVATDVTVDDEPRPATNLVTRAEFEAEIERYDADEATLVVVGVDDFDALADSYPALVVDAVEAVLADRLVAGCRKGDLVARLDAGNFSILLTDASRAVGLQIAKRLLAAIAQALDIDGAPDAVTATIALAHQFGLVDMEELIESADQALASGRRGGPGRLVIAS